MTLSRPLVALAVAWSFGQTKAYSSLPEDLYAYPKYSIGFLNGLPLPNVTAQHWLAHGLKGGEKRISRATLGPKLPWDKSAPDYGWRDDKLGWTRRLAFSITPPRTYASRPREGISLLSTPSGASKTWNLLQPLTGKCLYVASTRMVYIFVLS
ncbi:hypothetical protein OPQ81_007166 [Rhizoctonia solani]|nr:hypothetical protein OPQ81_007166 [Rhizoctonia solani]